MKTDELYESLPILNNCDSHILERFKASKHYSVCAQNDKNISNAFDNLIKMEYDSNTLNYLNSKDITPTDFIRKISNIYPNNNYLSQILNNLLYKYPQNKNMHLLILEKNEKANTFWK